METIADIGTTKFECFLEIKILETIDNIIQNTNIDIQIKKIHTQIVV